MMLPRLPFAPLLVCLSILSPMRASGQGFEPEEGLFADPEALDPSTLELRRALLPETDWKLCLLVAMPSFEPQYAVYIVGEEGSSTVVSRTLTKIYPRRASGELVKSGQESDLLELVVTRRAPLDAETHRLLNQVCIRVLRSVQYSEESKRRFEGRERSIRLDGITYHASHWVPGAVMAGSAYTPAPGSLAAEFIDMELALKAYADAEPGPSRETFKAVLLKKARGLTARLSVRR